MSAGFPPHVLKVIQALDHSISFEKKVSSRSSSRVVDRQLVRYISEAGTPFQHAQYDDADGQTMTAVHFCGGTTVFGPLILPAFHSATFDGRGR